MLELAEDNDLLPVSPTALADWLGECCTSRNTVTKAIGEAFRSSVQPTALHNYLATLPELPLIVHDWYDDLPQKALAVRSGWSVWEIIQGMNGGRQRCTPPLRYLQAAGASARPVTPNATQNWDTLLYQPRGSIARASRLFASDSEFAATSTAGDGRTSIPEPVQCLCIGRRFLFLGCRFDNELDRAFARQIMERSAADTLGRYG